MSQTHFKSFGLLFISNTNIAIIKLLKIPGFSQCTDIMNNRSSLPALDFYISSIMVLCLNTDYGTQTISSSSPHCCDGAPRKGRSSAFPQGSWEPLCLSRKKQPSGLKGINLLLQSAFLFETRVWRKHSH